MSNIFETELPKKGEIFDTLLSHKNIKIERIVSSDNISDKIYKQTQDEWVILLKGRAELDVDGKVIEMAEGDFIFIPSGQAHKVVEAEKGTAWLAVHIF